MEQSTATAVIDDAQGEPTFPQDSMDEQENTEINALKTAGGGEDAVDEEEEGADVAQLATPIGEAEGEIKVLQAQILRVKETYAKNPQALIDGLTELAKPILEQHSEITSQFERGKFETAILLGTVVNELYEVVTKIFRWGYYVSERFPGVSPSTLLNYRNIASRPDSHPYANLGVAMVIKLISVTRKDEGDNRIKVFLEQHGIAYDPAEPPTPQLKDQIEAAIKKAKEAAKDKTSEKTKKQIPVTKLTESLQKHAGEFIKASDKDVEGLADEIKSQLTEVLKESLQRLNS